MDVRIWGLLPRRTLSGIHDEVGDNKNRLDALVLYQSIPNVGRASRFWLVPLPLARLHRRR